MTDPKAIAEIDAEVRLRPKSDALLKLCGWKREDHASIPRFVWINPEGGRVLSNRPHPHANAQDAIDLAEAMGLKVATVEYGPDDLYRARLFKHDWGARGPTIAEAISAAIAEAVKEPA